MGAEKSPFPGPQLRTVSLDSSALYNLRDRPQTRGNPTQVVQDVLGRTLRKVIRPRAQGEGGLYAWTKDPKQYPSGQGGARGGPTCGAHGTGQLVQRKA
jgi:hypothetical protein